MAKKRGALLWIDVPGLGGRVSAQPYAEGARMMRVFRAILLPPCDAFGGRLASAGGDSFPIVFRRPPPALLAAGAPEDRAPPDAPDTREGLPPPARGPGGRKRGRRHRGPRG